MSVLKGNTKVWTSWFAWFCEVFWVKWIANNFQRSPLAAFRNRKPMSPFTRALIPFIRALPSWFNHLPQGPPPNTTTSGIRASTNDLLRERDIQSIASINFLLSTRSQAYILNIFHLKTNYKDKTTSLTPTLLSPSTYCLLSLSILMTKHSNRVVCTLFLHAHLWISF